MARFLDMLLISSEQELKETNFISSFFHPLSFIALSHLLSKSCTVGLGGPRWFEAWFQFLTWCQLIRCSALSYFTRVVSMSDCLSYSASSPTSFLSRKITFRWCGSPLVLLVKTYLLSYQGRLLLNFYVLIMLMDSSFWFDTINLGWSILYNSR